PDGRPLAGGCARSLPQPRRAQAEPGARQRVGGWLRTVESVDLLRVDLRRPRQAAVLPAVLKAETCLRPVLQRGTLEAIDHVARVREAVLAQEGGARLAALTARAAHGDDLGVRTEAALGQLQLHLVDEVRIAVATER